MRLHNFSNLILACFLSYRFKSCHVFTFLLEKKETLLICSVSGERDLRKIFQKVNQLNVGDLMEILVPLHSLTTHIVSEQEKYEKD